MNTHLYHWPDSEPRDGRFHLAVDGRNVPVFATGIAGYAIWEADGPHTIRVSAEFSLHNAAVRPYSRGVKAEFEDGFLHASLPGPGTYFISGDQGPMLHLFVHPLGTENRQAVSGETIRFEPGKVHEVGLLELQAGQNLDIPGGAIVRGCVHAHGLDGLKLAGRGILDMQTKVHGPQHHMVQIDGCRNVTIQDLTLVRPRSWMIVVGGCEDVRVENVREIGEVIGSDGIDIVGSRRVQVTGAGFRNNDDCVAIKSFDPRVRNPNILGRWDQDVDQILIENCTFLNDQGGNGVEIGHELRADYVSNITFRNLDIGQVNGVGAPLSIHAGDRAVVQDVLFEDIRIEHHYEKFLDFRVMRSQFNRDPERGHIRRVTLRRVHAHAADCNWGYTVSTIGGWDAEHRVEDLVFEDVTYGDRRLTSLDDIEIFTRHLGDVTFR